MADLKNRKTAAQRLEDRFNDFLANEFFHLSVKVAKIEALQWVGLVVGLSVLAGVIAAIILTVLR